MLGGRRKRMMESENGKMKTTSDEGKGKEHAAGSMLL